MARWEGAPFAYLNGMKSEPDAPLADNPAMSYCPGCRAEGRKVCDDPGHCGNLRPMRPASEAIVENPPQPARPVKLDDSRGQTPIQQPKAAQSRPRPAVGRQEGSGHAFDRLMGRKTTITQGPLVDGEEKSWEWFMENVQRDIDILDGKRDD